MLVIFINIEDDIPPLSPAYIRVSCFNIDFLVAFTFTQTALQVYYFGAWLIMTISSVTTKYSMIVKKSYQYSHTQHQIAGLNLYF
jgi:hypothetical protein